MGKQKVQEVNPYEVARADAQFNRIDQYTPFGQLTFDGPDNAVANLRLSRPMQEIFNREVRSDRQLLDLALGRQQGFEQGLPDLTESLSFSRDDPEFSRDAVEDAYFSRGARRLDDRFDRGEEALLQSLGDRGLQGAGTDQLTEGSFNERMLFEQARNDAYQNLADQSILAGGQEQDRVFQQALTEDLTNAQLSEANRARQFNELAALLGLDQTAQPGLNNFFTPGQADVTGGFAMNQQAQQANAANATQVISDLLGGITGLGSAFIGRK